MPTLSLVALSRARIPTECSRVSECLSRSWSARQNPARPAAVRGRCARKPSVLERALRQRDHLRRALRDLRPPRSNCARARYASLPQDYELTVDIGLSAVPDRIGLMMTARPAMQILCSGSYMPNCPLSFRARCIDSTYDMPCS